ncbi:hypothetical protein KKE03_04410, partial [Patescibacteria group bacterium]|nr:hypothetical protein [Patescibacteria group bacterium]
MKKFFIFLISSFFLLFFSFLSVSQVGALTVNSRPPNVPTLPSPGDTLSVYVSASDIAYKGVYCNFVYGVEVTPSNHVDPDSQSKEVELLEGNWTSDSQIFVFDVVSDRCVTGSVPFTATPYWYYIRCDGTVEPGMFGSGETITLTEGIGSTLNVNVYKPDGSPASGATINISGTYSSSVTGSSAQFRRLNCSLNHTINASLNIGGVNCTASRSSCSGSSGCICNGDSRSLDLTLSCPASGLASLTATCPDGTPTLSANWNLSGSACDIYIYAGTSSYTISSNCTGSWTGTSLPGGPAIVPGGTYHLRASNETTTTDGGEATVNCASPPPSASPTPAPWGGCGSCPDDSCGSGATKRNCMDGAGNYSCQDWDKCVTDPWGVCKWDPGNCEDPWIDPTTDPKNCSDYTNTMYFTTVGPPPTYQDLPRNPEPGEAFNVHVLGGWGYMSIALDITKPSDPSGVTYTGRFTPGVPVSEYAAHWIFPISNAEASLNNTPYLFEFSHNIRSQYCVSKTLFVSPPVISPWIQTTGDVHSNERINAQGGPEDTITGIVCPGQTSIPRVTEGLISAYDLLEN